MKRVLVPAVALLFATSFATAGEVESGLECGSSPGAFNVKDVTGPNKGKSLCYRCAYGGKPVVSIFTREINDDVAALVKSIDNRVGKNKDQKMSAFLVLLTDDPDADEAKLTKLAEEKKIKNVPLTMFDGITGPPAYKISEDAAVNVMMWVESDVKSNVAFTKAALSKKERQNILKETAKILAAKEKAEKKASDS